MGGLHKLPAHLTPLSPAAWIATFFGSGLLKPASGTWGSLAALAPGLIIAQHFGAAGLIVAAAFAYGLGCLLYTSPSPRDYAASRMPSSA